MSQKQGNCNTCAKRVAISLIYIHIKRSKQQHLGRKGRGELRAISPLVLPLAAKRIKGLVSSIGPFFTALMV